MDPTDAEKEDDGRIKLLRQQKQSLRKLIRSRIKSTYPRPLNSSAGTNNTDTTEQQQQLLLLTKSNQVFTQLFTLSQYKSAKTIGFFLSMPYGEIQTRNAIRQIVTDDKILYVPRVGLDFEKCDMDLIRCWDTATSSMSTTTSATTSIDSEMFYDNWPRNKWGIPEPPPSDTTTTTDSNNYDNNIAKQGDIDLLIVPGLAFDTNGHRLGQGKGYYDRFIAKMRNDNDDVVDSSSPKLKQRKKNEKPLLVGVCLDEQFLEEIPHGVDLGDMKDDNGRGNDNIIPVSDHDYVMDMVITPSGIHDHTK